MSRSRIFLGAAAALLLSAAGCLDDAPSGPSAASGGVRLQLHARLEGAQVDRTVMIRVFYLRQNEEEVNLPSTPTSVSVASGTTTVEPVTVTLTPCLEDPERERGESNALGCILNVELRLLGADNVVLSQQTQTTEPAEPGETVDVPEFALPQASIELSETEVAFTAAEFTAVPAAQQVIIGSATGVPLGTLSEAFASSSAWLTRSIDQETGVLTLQPSTTQLPPGTYTGTVTVHSSRAGIEPKTIMVSYTILGRPQALDVTGAGSGDGRVTSTPAGIDCVISAGTRSGVCTAPFSLNQSVTLTATATNGSFGGWGGACSGAGLCEVRMDQARAVTASFTAPPQRLAVTLAGNGAGTVTSNPAGISCAVTELGGNGLTCGELFAYGTQVTLSASASSGSTFAGWTGACSGTGSCTVTLDQARSVSATFTAPGRTLTVSGGGSGNGRVTSQPSGIDCTITAGSASGICSVPFGFGARVTLQATGTFGSFSGWSGDCSGSGTCQVTMDVAHSVAATFTAPPQRLTAGIRGSGAGSIASEPAGVSCAVSELGTDGQNCAGDFSYGTRVTLRATPSLESSFTGWSGECSGTDTCIVTMTQARNVTATFTAPARTLSVAGNGSGSGRVTSQPAGIDCTVAAGSTSGSCSTPFAYGTVVTLTASASFGSFSGWSGACSGNGPCQVTMDVARGVTATFTAPPQRITASIRGNGTGSVVSEPQGLSCTVSELGSDGQNCDAQFPYGSSVTLTATPSGGSAFDGWAGSCSGTGQCTVTLDQARSVTATFTAPPQILTVAIPEGGGSVSKEPSPLTSGCADDASNTCSFGYAYGTPVTLIATPVNGYVFTGWSGDCTGTGSCQVTMTGARRVDAHFSPGPRTLTVEGAGTGGGRVTSDPPGVDCTIGSGKTDGRCNVDFAFGTTVTLVAVPTEEGGAFAGWSGDCEGTGSCTLTMNAPHSVTASFRGPPPPGGDVVVFNDINQLDDNAMANPDNQTMVRNIVTFSTNRVRAGATEVWVDRGRNSICFSNGECAEPNQTIMTRVMSEAGFTITGVQSSSGFYEQPIPSSVKVLWLFMPNVAFTRGEINNLKQFAAEGGRIVVLGEHVGFYGAQGIALENQFMQDMGAVMTNVGNQIDCGYVTQTATSLRSHQITEGMSSVTMACSSEIILGPEDFALYYDRTNSKVLSAVARIDTRPLPANATLVAKSTTRLSTKRVPALSQPSTRRSATGVRPE